MALSKYENVSAYDDPVWGLATSGDLYVTEEGLVFVPEPGARARACVPAVLVSLLPFGWIWSAVVSAMDKALRPPSSQTERMTQEDPDASGIATRPGYLKLYWECISEVRGGFWGRSLNIEASRGTFLFTGTVPDAKVIRNAVALRRGCPIGHLPRVAIEGDKQS